MEKTENTEKRRPVRPTERFIDISGLDAFENPKAHVVLVHSIHYSDGSSVTCQELSIPAKPIVTVFKHAGFVNVLLDFLSRQDGDLAVAWDLMMQYSNPANGTNWTPEEVENGYYLDADGQKQMIYYHLAELVLIPAGHENEYQIHGFNPAFYTLQPNGPKGEPCVLQLTFPEDWLVVTEDIGSVDLEAIRREVMEEMAVEMGTGIDPVDLEGADEGI